MSGAVDTLLAKQAIVEVLYRYCHAVDRIDPVLGAMIWHDDGLALYEGIFEGTGAGFIEFVFEQHRNCDATSHQLTNMLIEVGRGRPGHQRELRHRVHPGVRRRHRGPWSVHRFVVLPR